jgi:hypothetical protein
MHLFGTSTGRKEHKFEKVARREEHIPNESA